MDYIISQDFDIWNLILADDYAHAIGNIEKQIAELQKALHDCKLIVEQEKEKKA